MINYGEELTYWFLRLNGFFPVTDFVMHPGNQVDYLTDCDVLAVRPPYVTEDVGGNPGDWHPRFAPFIQAGDYIGVVGQSKINQCANFTRFDVGYLEYAIARLGMFRDHRAAAAGLQCAAGHTTSQGVTVVALLVAQPPLPQGNFIGLSLQDIRAFIRSRMMTYDSVKYPNKHFFPSALIQNLIDEVHHGREPRAVGDVRVFN